MPQGEVRVWVWMRVRVRVRVFPGFKASPQGWPDREVVGVVTTPQSSKISFFLLNKIRKFSYICHRKKIYASQKSQNSAF